MKKRILSLGLSLCFILSTPLALTACGEAGAYSCQHSWQEATCTMKTTCSLCGAQKDEALGHNIVQHAAKEPTCSTPGYTAYESCTRCEYTTYQEVASFTAEEVYEKAKKCTVEITTYDKSGQSLALGSGFVYKSNGQIITNYHVIEDACSADIFLNEQTYRVSSVLGYDIDKDIAILKIAANNLPIVPICTKAMSTGATVYALGSSRGLTSTFSRGIITTAKRELNNVNYIQHDAAISSGNSGGPLINEFCEIIGINTLAIKDSQNLNFAISASEISTINTNNPMTLKEVYEKECDAFAKLKNYAMNKGTYSSGEYLVVLGTDVTDSGTKYSRGLFYNPTTDKLTLIIDWDDEILMLMLDEEYYSYDYYFKISSTYYMMGTLYANTFSPNTTYLSYTKTNLPYSYTTTYKRSAALLAQILIFCINEDFKSIGVTAHDLDFINF